jgi:hypothetical protein
LVSIYERARLPSLSEAVRGSQGVAVVAERRREALVEEELEQRPAGAGLGVVDVQCEVKGGDVAVLG